MCPHSCSVYFFKLVVLPSFTFSLLGQCHSLKKVLWIDEIYIDDSKLLSINRSIPFLETLYLVRNLQLSTDRLLGEKLDSWKSQELLLEHQIRLIPYFPRKYGIYLVLILNKSMVFYLLTSEKYDNILAPVTCQNSNPDRHSSHWPCLSLILLQIVRAGSVSLAPHSLYPLLGMLCSIFYLADALECQLKCHLSNEVFLDSSKMLSPEFF